MKRLIIFLIVLIASVWLGMKIAEDPGYALLVYRHWSVEMPIWFAVLSVIIALLIFYFILRVIDSLDTSLYRWKNWLRWRRKSKSYSKTNRGLIELIEGNWKSAEHYLLEGIPQSDAPVINYLAAAKAAQKQQAYERRDTYLRKAHDLAPQAEIAISLTQAELQFKQGKLEQALAVLGHLRNRAPENAAALKLLERVYTHLADWPNLLTLLPALRKAKIMNAEQSIALEQRVYIELLHSAANKGLAPLQDIWRCVPKKLQRHPALITAYAEPLLTYPNTAADTEELIYQGLKKTWDINLVKLYGKIPGDAKKQLAHAESWHKKHGNDAMLLLTLARLCVRCQLWGKARSYFEESLACEALPDTLMDYGKLLEQLDEERAAMQCYRDGLMLVVKND